MLININITRHVLESFSLTSIVVISLGQRSVNSLSRCASLIYGYYSEMCHKTHKKMINTRQTKQKKIFKIN